MSGRGAFAVEKNVPYTYETIDKIAGVKVLKGTGQAHNLPEESHSSNAYIKVDSEGRFVRYREFNSNKTAHFDIDYHPERAITGNVKEKVLHIHFYDSYGIRDKVGRKLTDEEYQKYKKYFRGRTK